MAAVAAFAGTGTLGVPVPDWYTPSFTATVPSTTVTSFDDVDRPVAASLVGAGGVVKATTTTSYDGLVTTTTPPSNTGASEPDVAATTVTTDVYGNPLTRVQGGVKTSYTYDADSNLVAVTSPMGKVSRYGYDWLKHRITSTDPDAGTSTADYYPSGTVKHSRDAAGGELFTAIDVLGRPTATYAGADASGVKLTETVYDGTPLGADGPVKGMVTSQTSYTRGQAYTQAFGYDVRYRTVRTDQTIPAVPDSPAAARVGGDVHDDQHVRRPGPCHLGHLPGGGGSGG